MSIYAYRAVSENGLGVAPRLYTSSASDGDIIRHQIMLKSGAQTPVSWFAQQGGGDAAGGNSTPYNSVEDEARLAFACDDGSTAYIIIPAPVAAVFGLDGQTVDSGAISGIIGACIAHGQSGSGGFITNLRWGKRRTITIAR